MHDTQIKNVPKNVRTYHRNKITPNMSNLSSGCTRTNQTAPNKCTPTSQRTWHIQQRPNRTQMKNLLLNNGAHQQNN